MSRFTQRVPNRRQQDTCFQVAYKEGYRIDISLLPNASPQPVNLTWQAISCRFGGKGLLYHHLVDQSSLPFRSVDVDHASSTEYRNLLEKDRGQQVINTTACWRGKSSAVPTMTSTPFRVGLAPLLNPPSSRDTGLPTGWPPVPTCCRGSPSPTLGSTGHRILPCQRSPPIPARCTPSERGKHGLFQCAVERSMHQPCALLSCLV